jgi:hypothetical protein
MVAGLDLNQRPLGYEYEAAMIGNPLISREKRSAPWTSTFCVDTAFFVLFGPDSGSYGSKMGAAVTRAALVDVGKAIVGARRRSRP